MDVEGTQADHDRSLEAQRIVEDAKDKRGVRFPESHVEDHQRRLDLLADPLHILGRQRGPRLVAVVLKEFLVGAGLARLRLENQHPVLGFPVGRWSLGHGRPHYGMGPA